MKNLNKFIFVVRHGERADLIKNANLDILKCGRYDSELTEKGKLEAFKIGQKIKTFLYKQKMERLFKPEYISHKDKISICCSPFARTIMTANEIVKGLKLILPIKIEKGLCEHLSEKWYPEHPEKFMVALHNERTQGKDYLMSQIKDQELIHEFITDMPKYPESHEECHSRFKNVYEKLINYYMEHRNKHVLIIVSHHFPLEIFHRYYHQDNISLPAEYGLTIVFKYDTKSKKPDFVKKLFPENK
jgi:broad specificity phosphatase PhoE